jgi:hypothetical protein
LVILQGWVLAEEVVFVGVVELGQQEVFWLLAVFRQDEGVEMVVPLLVVALVVLEILEEPSD